MKLQRPLPLVAALALLTALAGCATTDATPKKTAADNTGYEYVTPLGSNIPVRVRKGTTATNSTSPTATMNAQEAANMINGAPGAVREAGGGR